VTEERLARGLAESRRSRRRGRDAEGQIADHRPVTRTPDGQLPQARGSGQGDRQVRDHALCRDVLAIGDNKRATASVPAEATDEHASSRPLRASHDRARVPNVIERHGIRRMSRRASPSPAPAPVTMESRTLTLPPDGCRCSAGLRDRGPRAASGDGGGRQGRRRPTAPKEAMRDARAQTLALIWSLRPGHAMELRGKAQFDTVCCRPISVLYSGQHSGPSRADRGGAGSAGHSAWVRRSAAKQRIETWLK
jgi:hypothetical protein